MAKFTAYVETWSIGSRKEVPFEVDDEELEGLSENERDKLLAEIAHDVISGYYEWGYAEVES